MGLINWIFDIYQHTQIDKARDEARQARADLAAMHGSGFVAGDKLEKALGELALATKTLQRLMVEKGLISHAELASKMREVDREDGAEDGRSRIP